MAAFLAFMAGPLGKLAAYGVAILFIIVMLVGLYFSIVHNASQNQLLKDQAVIQQQIIQNQKEFLAKTNEIIQLQQSSASNLQKQLDDIKDTTDTVNAYLNDPDTVKLDRDSSELIKKTIEQLSKRK